MIFADIAPSVITERIKNPNDETVTVTFTPRGDAKDHVINLLMLLKRLGDYGSSRSVGVHNDNEYGSVEFDGDGADMILDLKVNGTLIK